MAITEARMKQLTGAYADLNKSNMLVGEMAVPSDHVPIVRNGVNSWEDLLTSQSAGDIIALSETMTEQIDSFEQLVIDKVGINDSTATLTQAYSGSKTQGLIDTLNTNLTTINNNVALKANQSDLNTTNNNLSTQKSRIDLLVSTPNSSFYEKTTSGITGALLVVASGATTGQINLADVTPLATGYTPIVSDYVRLVYGVSSGSTELIDARIDSNGVTYDSTGEAIRGQIAGVKKEISSQGKYQIGNNIFPYNKVYGKTITYEYSKLPLDSNGINSSDLSEFSNPEWYHIKLCAKGMKSIAITEDGIAGISTPYSYIIIVENDTIIKTIGIVEKYTFVNPTENTFIYLNYFTDGAYATKCDIEFSERTVYEIDWSNYKWSCIGDSLTAENEYASKHYFDYISDATGINAINMGLSGTGYLNNYNNQTRFYERALLVDTDATIITFFGSFNDVNGGYYGLGEVTDHNTTTLCGAINLALDNIFTRNPACRVGIITPTPWNTFQPSDTTSLASQYVEKMLEICKLRGIPCLDLFHTSGMRPWDANYRSVYYKNDTNGVHPDNDGQKIFASHVYEFLKKLLI